MKNIRTALIALTSALTIAGPASAQLFEPAEGAWYVGGFVGAAFPDDFEATDFVDDDALADVEVELETDVFFGGAVGGVLPFRTLGFIKTRLELEVSYFETNLDVDIDDDDLDLITPDLIVIEDLDDLASSLDVLFITANSFAELSFSDDQAIIPYVGGGLGIAVSGDFGDFTDTNFASFSAIGVTIPINQLDVYGEGRYFRIYDSGPDIDGFTLTGGVRLRF